jgi:hypothetical protein
MNVKTIALFAPLLILAACGGGSDKDTDMPLDLQGVWYGVDQGFSGQHSYPALFVQTGRDIVRTECDRSTTRLQVEGGILLGPTGTPYVLQPATEGMLLGRKGASAGEEMRRYSRATVFESGSVSLALPAVPPLQATRDVCAMKGFVSLGSNGAEPIAATVMIAAPYQGGHAEIRMTLPRRANVFPYSVRLGEYVVRDRGGFLQDPDGSIQVEVWSPAYGTAYGANTVQMSTGNVRVRTSGNGVYSFEGAMSTTSGAPVTFSAAVTLERKP